jgi:hypothetical protein
MPDPNVLYVVTAIVVLALVAWVLIVLSRPANQEPKAPGEKPPLQPSAAVDVDKDRDPIAPG